MTKFAIGCLVQWYECDIIDEYLSTLKKAIDAYEGEVEVDICIVKNTSLEKPISEEAFTNAIKKIDKACKDKFRYSYFHTEVDEIYTIADYRREFNNKFCNRADVLVWVKVIC